LVKVRARARVKVIRVIRVIRVRDRVIRVISVGARCRGG
jgi:hypothetical protein